MRLGVAKRLRRWGTWLGLVALLLQLLAGAVPMPAGGIGQISLASLDIPAWVGASVCRAGDDGSSPADPVCPICFVLCHSAGLPPQAISGVAHSAGAEADLPAGDHVAVPASVRILPARGPPGLA